MCKKGCKGSCGCKPISTTKGDKGDIRVSNVIDVKDDQGNIVTNATEIKFTDANALVTDMGGGKAEVAFIAAATVWNDIQNLNYYSGGGVNSFKPQYTVEGNKITFRGLLFVPLNNGGVPESVTNVSSYLNKPSAVIDETNMSIITNANSNNGTPQGRFFTTNVVSAKNLPLNATPVARDIVFYNVQAIRRYTFSEVAVYRSVVTLRIGALTTAFEDSGNKGTGCLMILSAFNDEYDGIGTVPLGNDPLALMISRVTGGVTAVDYIASKDDATFNVPSAVSTNRFDVNGHNISSLGGFIINLEGLTGYLN